MERPVLLKFVQNIGTHVSVAPKKSGGGSHRDTGWLWVMQGSDASMVGGGLKVGTEVVVGHRPMTWQNGGEEGESAADRTFW